MKVYAQRFNTYLALAAVLVLFCGCKTTKKPKEVSAIRVHLQASASVAGATDTISVVRADPVSVTVMQDPILTEANVVAARIINATGGFAIEIQFDESATLMLEQYTASNPGLHLVIFGQWGDKLLQGRWLAAPLITHRITNGRLAFTPDCSREEAERFVLGLNNVAGKDKKGASK
jgi:hypothetical protein